MYLHKKNWNNNNKHDDKNKNNDLIICIYHSLDKPGNLFMDMS